MGNHDDWVKYPTGKIPKGAWCDCCGRHNGRKVTCSVIGVRDGKVLMVHRAKDPQKDWWAFPGGYLDWEETVEECATRELAEETGYRAENIRLLGVYSDPKRDLDGRENVDCCYMADIKGDKTDGDDEVDRVKWFDLDDLPERIAFDHRRMIEDYKRAKKVK